MKIVMMEEHSTEKKWKVNEERKRKGKNQRLMSMGEDGGLR